MKSGTIGAAAAIFLAVLPFTTARYLYSGGVNAKYFLVMLFASLLTLLAAWLVYKSKLVINLKGRWLVYALGLVLLAYYVSAFAGLYPERSLWSDIQRSTGVFFLTYVSIIALLLSETMNVRGWSLVRRAVAISGGAFGLLALLSPVGFGLLDKFLWLDLRLHGLTFGNSTFAGAYLVLALIMALIELSHTERGSRIRMAVIASIVLILLSPMLFNFGSPADPVSFLGDARSSSATAWLLVLFLGGWKLLKHRNIRRVWAGLFVVGALAGVAMLFSSDSFVQEKYIETSSAARIIVWDSAHEAIKERPLLGYGSENFEQAIQGHFDNRLYLDENLGEIWFDRAHNVVVDILVDVGIVGALPVLILVACFYATVIRARKRATIGEWEALLLGAMPVAHFLQLQTSFDTVGTYALLGIYGGYAMWLERETIGAEVSEHGPNARKVIAGVLLVIALFGLKFLVFDEYGRQSALIATMRTADTAKQDAFVRESLGRTSSFSTLRVSTGSYIKGALEHIAKGGGTGLILPRLSLYEEYYKRQMAEAPDHYRMRLNYAYLLLVKSTLGENRIAEARAILKDSYRLSPTNPLTYGLDAVASLYSGRISEARSIMSEGLALNPEAPFSKEIAAYIERQIAQFPNITVLELKNL